MTEPQTVVFLDRDTIGPGVELRRPRFSHHWQNYPASDESQVVKRARDASVLITNKVPVTHAHLATLPKLKLIAVAATGTDVVDLDACRDAGVAVCNVRGYAVTSVPEHILALLLALRRRLPAYRRRVQLGHWQDSGQFCFFDQPITDLAQTRLGIVGTGSIASALGRLAAGLGLEVVYHSISGRQLDDRQMLALDDLLQTSDVVSLNCPLTADSHHLIDAGALQQMPKTALLINTARGALVDMIALEKALVGGRIGGAGIDVAEQEPPPADHPLMRLAHLDNVIVTPHVAWASTPAMQVLADQLLDCIDAFFEGAEMNRVV